MCARDFRKIAADELRPVSNTMALVELFLLLIVMAFSAIGFIPYAGPAITAVLTLIAAGPLMFSEVSLSKKIKEGEQPKIEDWFLGFKRFSQSFVLAFVEGVFIFLWSLLLIVPGIIKTLAYSCAVYISHDDESVGALDSITKSRELMVGYKWRLFCLYLSYIGWFLLSILTLGILFLWVAPKVRQAQYAFYLNILKEKGLNKKTVEEVPSNNK